MMEDELSHQQKRVVDLVLEGRSVFVTGAAGTGKSFLIKKLHQVLKDAGKGSSTFLTGTTGVAAVGIGGCTVHSFAGIGQGREPAEQLARRAERNDFACQNWSACEVLVIDEISMMSAELFDKLNVVGQRMKGSSLPFGGVQLVLCGDFFQLPPVGVKKGMPRFCFEAGSWNAAVHESIVLKEVFRQTDLRFVRILHEIREGRVTPDGQRALEGQVRPAANPRGHGIGEGGGGSSFSPSPYASSGGGVEASPARRGGGGAAMPSPSISATMTKIFSRNDKCAECNKQELDKIQGPSEIYTASDSGSSQVLDNVKLDSAVEKKIELKVGARVMLLRNLDTSTGLVNGAMGVVTEFVGPRLPNVRFDAMEGCHHRGPISRVINQETFSLSVGDREVASREQVPLRLAWAITVHKSQGATLANAMVSMEDMFDFGQAYVALSRTTTLTGLHLLDFTAGNIKAHESVIQFYASIEGGLSQQEIGAAVQSPTVDINDNPGRGVYVLELDGGRYYVGKSSNIARRVAEHLSPEGGAGWTRTHKALRQVPTVVPSMPGPLESWERAETLEIAHSKGIDNVRGHAWTTVNLTKSQRESFVEQVCERKDLCRACGEPGHMVWACRRRSARAVWMGDSGCDTGGGTGGDDGYDGDAANSRFSTSSDSIKSGGQATGNGIGTGGGNGSGIGGSNGKSTHSPGGIPFFQRLFDEAVEEKRRPERQQQQQQQEPQQQKHQQQENPPASPSPRAPWFTFGAAANNSTTSTPNNATPIHTDANAGNTVGGATSSSRKRSALAFPVARLFETPVSSDGNNVEVNMESPLVARTAPPSGTPPTSHSGTPGTLGVARAGTTASFGMPSRVPSPTTFEFGGTNPPTGPPTAASAGAGTTSASGKRTHNSGTTMRAASRDGGGATPVLSSTVSSMNASGNTNGFGNVPVKGTPPANMTASKARFQFGAGRADSAFSAAPSSTITAAAAGAPSFGDPSNESVVSKPPPGLSPSGTPIASGVEERPNSASAGPIGALPVSRAPPRELPVTAPALPCLKFGTPGSYTDTNTNTKTRRFPAVSQAVPAGSLLGPSGTRTNPSDVVRSFGAEKSSGVGSLPTATLRPLGGGIDAAGLTGSTSTVAAAATTSSGTANVAGGARGAAAGVSTTAPDRGKVAEEPAPGGEDTDDKPYTTDMLADAFQKLGIGS